MRFDEQFTLTNGVIASDPAWTCLNSACAWVQRA
jgi:hypothetical protein